MNSGMYWYDVDDDDRCELMGGWVCMLVARRTNEPTYERTNTSNTFHVCVFSAACTWKKNVTVATFRLDER